MPNTKIETLGTESSLNAGALAAVTTHFQIADDPLNANSAENNDAAAVCKRQMSDIIEIHLLAHDWAFSGLKMPDEFSSAAQFVVALLQGIQGYYPLYSLTNINNLPMPENWASQVQEILKKVGLTLDAKINKSTAQRLLDTVNAFFSYGEVRLKVRCHGDESWDLVSDEPSSAESTVRPLELCQTAQGYIVMAPATKCFETPLQQCMELSKLIKLQAIFFDLISEARLLAYCDADRMSEASVAGLTAALDAELAKAQKLKTFAEFEASYFSQESIEQRTSLAMLAPTVNRLVALSQTVLHERDASEQFETFRYYFLLSLKRVVQMDLLNRREQENRFLEDDPVKRLAHQIQEKQVQIDETHAKLLKQRQAIEKKEADLAQKEADMSALAASVAKQAEALDREIAEKKSALKEKETALAAQQAKVSEQSGQAVHLETEMQDLQKEQQVLERKKNELDEKHRELSKELKSIRIAKLDLAKQKDQLQIEINFAERNKSDLTARKQHMKDLFAFLEKVQAILIADHTLFAEKAAIFRNKVDALRRSGENKMRELYDFLLETLGSQDANLAEQKYKLAANDGDLYFHEALKIIDEILGVPTKSGFNSLSNKFEYGGYNLSWKECESALSEYICARLNRYGLAIRDGLLCVKGTPPWISDLPPRLQDRLALYFRSHYRPIKFENRNNPPRWEEISATGDRSKQLIEEARVRYEDLISCFIDGVRIAGENLHVEKDITLPGVDLEAALQGTIILKSGCVINVSGGHGIPFDESLRKARDGEDYTTGSNPMGHHGEHGLGGNAGQSAGHIYLVADKGITGIKTLRCHANGGNGANGQAGGDGEKGRNGQDAPDAQTGGCPGISRSYTRMAQAREPAVGANGRVIASEISGPGGLGGERGPGGVGGFAGNITVESGRAVTIHLDSETDEPYQGDCGDNCSTRFVRKSGKSGESATEISKGGESGEPGYRGYAHISRRIGIPKKIWFLRVGTHWKNQDIGHDLYDLDWLRDNLPGVWQSSGYTDHNAYKLDSHWYRDHYRTLPEKQQSKSNHSRGKDNSHETVSEVRESAQQKPRRREDRTMQARYRENLHEQAKSLASLKELNRSRVRTDEAVAKLTQKITVHEKTATDVRHQSHQNAIEIEDAQQKENAKSTEKSELEQHRSALEIRLGALQDRKTQLTQDTIAALDALSEKASAQSEAARNVSLARLDYEAVLGLREELNAAKTKLQAAMQEEKVDIRAELNRAVDLEQQTRDILGIQSNDLQALKTRYERMIAEQAEAAERLMHLNDALMQMDSTSVKQKTIATSVQAAFSVDSGNMADAQQVQQKLQISNALYCADTRSPTKLAELLDEMRDYFRLPAEALADPLEIFEALGWADWLDLGKPLHQVQRKGLQCWDWLTGSSYENEKRTAKLRVESEHLRACLDLLTNWVRQQQFPADEVCLNISAEAALFKRYWDALFNVAISLIRVDEAIQAELWSSFMSLAYVLTEKTSHFLCNLWKDEEIAPQASEICVHLLQVFRAGQMSLFDEIHYRQTCFHALLSRTETVDACEDSDNKVYQKHCLRYFMAHLPRMHDMIAVEDSPEIDYILCGMVDGLSLEPVQSQTNHVADRLNALFFAVCEVVQFAQNLAVEWHHEAMQHGSSEPDQNVLDKMMSVVKDTSDVIEKALFEQSWPDLSLANSMPARLHHLCKQAYFSLIETVLSDKARSAESDMLAILCPVVKKILSLPGDNTADLQNLLKSLSSLIKQEGWCAIFSQLMQIMQSDISPNAAEQILYEFAVTEIDYLALPRESESALSQKDFFSHRRDHLKCSDRAIYMQTLKRYQPLFQKHLAEIQSLASDPADAKMVGEKFSHALSLILMVVEYDYVESTTWMNWMRGIANALQHHHADEIIPSCCQALDLVSGQMLNALKGIVFPQADALQAKDAEARQLAAPDYYYQAIEHCTKEVPAEELPERLVILASCLQHDQTQLQAEKMEKLFADLRDRVLKDIAPGALASSLASLKVFDNHINALYMARYHEQVKTAIQWQAGYREKLAAREGLLVKFEREYRSTDEVQAQRKKHFFSHILKRAIDADVDCQGLEDIAAVCQAVNRHVLASLAQSTYFSSSPNVRRALLLGDPDTFIAAWSNQMKQVCEGSDRSADVAQFIADSQTLLATFLFEGEGSLSLHHDIQDWSAKMLKQAETEADVQFAYLLEAAAYKSDFYAHTDILMQAYEANNPRQQLGSVVNALEGRIASQLNALLELIGMVGMPTRTRQDLIDEILGQLNTDAIVKQPQKVLEAVENAVVRARASYFQLEGGKDMDLSSMIQHCKKFKTVSSMIEKRCLAGVLFVNIQSAKLSLEDLIKLSDVILKIPASGADEVFLNSLMQAMLRRYSEQFTLILKKYPKLQYLLHPLSLVEALSQNDLRQALVVIKHVAKHLKTQKFTEAVSGILADPAIETANLDTDKLVQLINSGEKLPEKACRQLSLLGVLAALDAKPAAAYEKLISTYFSAYQPKSIPESYRVFYLGLLQAHANALINAQPISAGFAARLRQTMDGLVSGAMAGETIAAEMLMEFHEFLVSNLRKIKRDADVLTHFRGAHSQAFQQYFLVFEEHCYAARLSESVTHELLSDKPSTDWLKTLKKRYWSDCIHKPLFYQHQQLVMTLCDDPTFQKYVVQLASSTAILEVEQANRQLESRYFTVPEADRDRVREMVAEIYTVKRQLLSTYSVALADGEEPVWLDLMDHLQQMHDDGASLIDISRLLSVVSFIPSLRDIVEVLNGETTETAMHAVLLKVLSAAMARQVVADKSFLDAQLARFQDRLIATPQGLVFLTHFVKALFAGNHKKTTVFSQADFEALVDRLFAVGAYRDAALTDRLAKQPIQYWDVVLRRRELMIQLHLDPDNRDDQDCVEYLARLQKDFPALSAEWVRLIAAQREVSGAQLLPVLSAFYFQRWTFDQFMLGAVRDKPLPEWASVLADCAKARESEIRVGEPLSAAELVEKMKAEPTDMNAGIHHLLYPPKDSQGLVDIVSSIHARYESEYEKMDAAALKARMKDLFSGKFHAPDAAHIGKFLANGDLAEIIEFLALIYRAVSLTSGRKLYDAQLIGLICLLSSIDSGKSRLANISTGEGKTLVTQIMALGLALRGERVIVTTSSKALAEPNAKEAEELLGFFDISVSNNCDAEAENSEYVRERRYLENQVIYGDVGSFERDYLLSKCVGGKQGLNGHFSRILVDEVDSMFIDESDRVLYISHTIHDLKYLSSLFLFIWECVNAPDVVVETPEALAKIRQAYEKSLSEGSVTVPNHLRSFVDRRFEIWVKNAYLARDMSPNGAYSVIQKGDYLDQSLINDLPTGVEQLNAQWSNGLHQFIQLKHQQQLKPETLKALFISNISYFANQFFKDGKGLGWSGTVGGEAERELLADLYGVDFFCLPRAKPDQFKYEEHIVSGTEDKWLSSIISSVKSHTDTKEAFSTERLGEASKAYQLGKDRERDLKSDIAKLAKKHQENQGVLKKEQMKLADLTEQIQSAGIDRKTEDDTLEGDIADNDAFLARREDLMNQRQAVEEKIDSLKARAIANEQQHDELVKEQQSLAMQQATNEAILAGRNGRAVLVICADKKTSNQVAEALKTELEADIKAKKKSLYRYESYFDELDIQQLQPGDIIVATNIAGRGKDFKISKTLCDNKGPHLILTSVPPRRIAEQNFRRVARNGEPGTAQYVVYDPRARDCAVSIEMLRDEKDQQEAMRLKEIQQIKKPRIDAEESLFERYRVLEQEIRETLKSRAFSGGYIDRQVKSLQNRWAFWLDEQDQALANVYKTGTEALNRDFDTFVRTVKDLVANNNTHVVTEPGELFLLGQYFRSCGQHHRAIEIFDKVIEMEPEYCGFSHYYKAFSILSMSDNFAHKDRARTSLKAAVRSFDAELSRLSTLNQLIRLPNERQRRKGYGLSADMFTKTNADEMAVITIHKNAALDALGKPLTPDALRSGELFDEEADKVYTRMRETMTDHIKDHRISKKVTIKQDPDTGLEQIYYKDKVVPLPPNLLYCRDDILSNIRERLGAEKDHQARRLLPEEFHGLVVTRGHFLEHFKSDLVQTEVICLMPAKSREECDKSFWDQEVFKGHGKAIRDIVNQLQIRADKVGLASHFELKLPERQIEWASVIDLLINAKQFTVTHQYAFNDHMKQKIGDYLKCFVIKSAEADRIDQCDFEGLLRYMNMPEDQANALQTAIKQSADAGEAVDLERLNAACHAIDNHIDPFSADNFKLIYQLMQSKNLIENQLLADAPPDGYRRRQLEEAATVCYDIGQFVPDDIPLAESADAMITPFWSYLQSKHVVREPTVKLPMKNASENGLASIVSMRKQLDAMHEAVRQNIKTLVSDIPKLAEPAEPVQKEPMKCMRKVDGRLIEETVMVFPEAERKRQAHVSRLIGALKESLDSIAGTIRTIPRIDVSPNDLRNYFEGQKLPPVVFDYMYAACGQVLNLIEHIEEEEGSFWDAFICAVIGLAQIAAGALITACCPAAAYLGEILISEGISDLTYAVQGMINNNFSWEAWGEHKVQSLAISIATAGVGATLSNSAKVGQQAAKEAIKSSGSSIARVIMKKMAQAAITVAVNVGVSMFISKIAEGVVDAILSDFKKNFRHDLMEILAGNQLQEFKAHCCVLFDRLGEQGGKRAIERAIRDMDVLRLIREDVATKAMEGAQALSSRLSGLKVQSSAAAEAVLGAAELISTLLSCAEYIKALHDILTTSERVFDKLVHQLRQRVDRTEGREARDPVSTEKRDALVEEHVNQVANNIVGQIEAQVMQVFSKIGSKCVHAAISPAVSRAQQAVSDSIDALYKDADLDAQQQVRADDRKAAVMMQSRMPKADSLADSATGEVISAEQMDEEPNETTIQSVDGEQKKAEVTADKGKNRRFTVKAGRFYLIETDVTEKPYAATNIASGSSEQQQVLIPLPDGMLPVIESPQEEALLFAEMEYQSQIKDDLPSIEPYNPPAKGPSISAAIPGGQVPIDAFRLDFSVFHPEELWKSTLDCWREAAAKIVLGSDPQSDLEKFSRRMELIQLGTRDDQRAMYRSIEIYGEEFRDAAKDFMGKRLVLPSTLTGGILGSAYGPGGSLVGAFAGYTLSSVFVDRMAQFMGDTAVSAGKFVMMHHYAREARRDYKAQYENMRYFRNCRVLGPDCLLTPEARYEKRKEAINNLYEKNPRGLVYGDL